MRPIWLATGLSLVALVLLAALVLAGEIPFSWLGEERTTGTTPSEAGREEQEAASWAQGPGGTSESLTSAEPPPPLASRPPRTNARFIADLALHLSGGRWDLIEEARLSVSDSGREEALSIAEGANAGTLPSEAMALALVVEDFLEGPKRDPDVLREVERLLPSLLLAYDDPELLDARPVLSRLLGYFPDSRVEAFLLDRIQADAGSELEPLLVDALGGAGMAPAADFLIHRFEGATRLEGKREAYLALARIAKRTSEPGLAQYVQEEAFSSLVGFAGRLPITEEESEALFLTLGAALGLPPSQVIALRLLPGPYPPASKEAALTYLAAAGEPRDGPLLERAAADMADPALALRTREVARSLESRGREE